MVLLAKKIKIAKTSALIETEFSFSASLILVLRFFFGLGFQKHGPGNRFQQLIVETR